jgi:hypothetical protein
MSALPTYRLYTNQKDDTQEVSFDEEPSSPTWHHRPVTKGVSKSMALSTRKDGKVKTVFAVDHEDEDDHNPADDDDSSSRGLWNADVIDLAALKPVNAVHMFEHPVELARPNGFQWNPTFPTVDLMINDGDEGNKAKIRQLNTEDGKEDATQTTWMSNLFPGFLQHAEKKDVTAYPMPDLADIKGWSSPFPGEPRICTKLRHLELCFTFTESHADFADKLAAGDGLYKINISPQQIRRMLKVKLAKQGQHKRYHFLPHQITLDAEFSNFKVPMDKLLVTGHVSNKARDGQWVIWTTGAGVSNQPEGKMKEDVIFNGKTYSVIPPGRRCSTPSAPRALYVAEKCVNDPDFHRWIGFDYTKFDKIISQSEGDYVEVDLPDVEATNLSHEQLLAWFVLDEYPYFRVLTETGGKFQVTFDKANSAADKKLHLPFVKSLTTESKPQYAIRIFKPVLKHQIEEKKRAYHRDSILMNVDEGITLILRPLQGSEGAKEYQQLAKDARTRFCGDSNVSYTAILTLTFEDYEDEQDKKKNEAKQSNGTQEQRSEGTHEKQYQALLEAMYEKMMMNDRTRRDFLSQAGRMGMGVGAGTHYDPFMHSQPSSYYGSSTNSRR